MTGRLLTAREVADRLGINVETVLRWHRRGDLPGFTLPGGMLRFDEDELEAWLKARATGAAPRGVSATRGDRARVEGYAPLPSLTSATRTEEDP